MEDLFDPESTVDGVVHVVANGFVEVRGLDARNALVTEGGLDTTQKSREHQLGAEGFS